MLLRSFRVSKMIINGSLFEMREGAVLGGKGMELAEKQ